MYITDFSSIKQQAKALRTTGYRVIVDGDSFAWKRWCQALEVELSGVRFIQAPKIYRNPLQELVINFDRI